MPERAMRRSATGAGAADAMSQPDRRTTSVSDTARRGRRFAWRRLPVMAKSVGGRAARSRLQIHRRGGRVSSHSGLSDDFPQLHKVTHPHLKRLPVGAQDGDVAGHPQRATNRPLRR